MAEASLSAEARPRASPSWTSRGTGSGRSPPNTWPTTAPRWSRSSPTSAPTGCGWPPPGRTGNRRHQPEPVLRKLQLLQEEHRPGHEPTRGPRHRAASGPPFRYRGQQLHARRDGQLGPRLRRICAGCARPHRAVDLHAGPDRAPRPLSRVRQPHGLASGFYYLSGYSESRVDPALRRLHRFHRARGWPHSRCWPPSTTGAGRGEGQHLDISQHEAAITFMAPGLVDYFASGQGHARGGQPLASLRPPRHLPHAPTTAAGERWIAIAVADDEQWEALLRLLGAAPASTRFATAVGRLEHAADQWTSMCRHWSRARDAAELTAALQAAGRGGLPGAELPGSPLGREPAGQRVLPVARPARRRTDALRRALVPTGDHREPPDARPQASASTPTRSSASCSA